MNESKTKKQIGVKRKTKTLQKQEPLKPAVVIKKSKTLKTEIKKLEKKPIVDKKSKKTDNKKGKIEENKDVVPPKRSWPAFFFFQKEKRLELKKNNPNLSQKELVSKLGEMWRGLNEAQKKPYVDQERKDKARYMKEKEEFKATNNIMPVNKKKDKKGKAKTEQKGPKRAWPPFFFFQEQRREDLKKENPTLNHKEIVSKLGAEWRTFNDAQKQPFVEKSVHDQKRYDREKKEYQDSLPAEAKEASNSKGKGKTSEKKKPSENQEAAKSTKASKGKKRPRSKSVKSEAPKKSVKKPLPPVRPSGSRHSKRIKKNEQEQFKADVEEYKQVSGKPVPELEKVVKEQIMNAEKEVDVSNKKEPDTTPQPPKDETVEPDVKPATENSEEKKQEDDEEEEKKPIEVEQDSDVEMQPAEVKPVEVSEPKPAEVSPVKEQPQNVDVEMAEDANNNKQETVEVTKVETTEVVIEQEKPQASPAKPIVEDKPASPAKEEVATPVIVDEEPKEEDKKEEPSNEVDVPSKADTPIIADIPKVASPEKPSPVKSSEELKPATSPAKIEPVPAQEASESNNNEVKDEEKDKENPVEIKPVDVSVEATLEVKPIDPAPVVTSSPVKPTIPETVEPVESSTLQNGESEKQQNTNIDNAANP
jgi:hypothetical protein